MKESQQQEVFNKWIADHRGLLFKVIRSYADTEVDQNDLFQEIALQVYKSVPNFKGASSVVTWLYRIALNTAIKWISKEKKHTKNHHTINVGDQILETVENESYDEKVQWLYARIKKLDEVEKSLTLLLLDGYSYREIAEIIGISESNVGVKLHRIKKYLMEKAKTMN